MSSTRFASGPTRTVMRFILQVDLGMARIFLQTEWNETAHQAAIADVKRALESVLSFDQL